MNNPDTDFIQQPIDVGDIISYAITRGSSIRQQLAVVIAKDAIDPDRPHDAECRMGKLRKDGTGRRLKTQFLADHGTGKRTIKTIYDPSKLYRLTVRKLQEDYVGPDPEAVSLWNIDHMRKQTIQNVENVIVVTNLVSPELRDKARELV